MGAFVHGIVNAAIPFAQVDNLIGGAFFVIANNVGGFVV